MADLKQVTDQNFEDLLKEHAGTALIVDFWAPWCGPCRQMEPVLHEIAEEYSAKVVIGKLNVDENPAVAQRFDVLSIPTMLVFVGGKMVKKLVGATPKKRFIEELAPWIG